MLTLPLPLALAVMVSGLIWAHLWVRDGHGLRQILVRWALASGMWMLIVFLAVHIA